MRSRGDPTPLLKSRPTRLSDRYKSVSTLPWSWGTRTGTTPNTAALVSWWLSVNHATELLHGLIFTLIPDLGF